MQPIKEAARFFAFVLLFIIIAKTSQVVLSALYVFSDTFDRTQLNDVLIRELQATESRLWLWTKVIISTVSEEVICRGTPFAIILLYSFRRDVVVMACVVSSVAFGLFHGFNVYNLVVYGTTGVWYFIAGYLYLQRSGFPAALLMSSLVHIGFNSIALAATLFLYA